MRILIIIFIFFSYYSSLNANEIFNLIKIPNLEVFNLDSKNKIKYLSLKKSFTIGTTKNITCDKANESNLKKKYEIIKKNLDIYNYKFLKKNNIRFVVLCENLSISGIGTAGIPDIQKRIDTHMGKFKKLEKRRMNKLARKAQHNMTRKRFNKF